MNKKPLVVGNWKMELSYKGEVELAHALADSLKGYVPKSDVVICPSYVALPEIASFAKKAGKFEVGAQHVFWEEKGAFTGQISVNSIKPHVSWCIVGHSEARMMAGVTDDIVVGTVKLLKSHNIAPIVCIGETREEREGDRTVEKIRAQVDMLIQNLDRTSLVQTVIAYEPIWAIGSGVLPEPDDVAQVILLIRKQIADRYDQAFAERIRILYGGSVKPENDSQYVGGPNADGLLVGGASLHPQKFLDIIKSVDEAFA